MYKTVAYILAVLVMIGAFVALLVPAPTSAQQTAPPGTGPVPAAQAVSHMTLPAGFKATLFAGEPDLVQPIAFTFDDRGRLWVAEAITYPNWVMDAKPDTKGHDRITIFEDTDGDGRFDKRTVFADNLVNVSGFEIGFGGIYVCSAPNLLFIPANPGEDKPSGPPTAILDGWNIKNAEHNIFSNLTWGPDGWLYGLNGIQSKSAVGAPGTPDAQRVKFDCGVWRYHPVKHTFEVVCWGTTNPWGLDFDEYGQGFITNCVIKHVWQVIPGAHFQRMYGQDYNPNVFSLMESCADHVHFVGAWGDAKINPTRSSDAGGGHAHVGAMVYLGDNFPQQYHNTLFTLNLHGNRANNDILENTGSGYVAHHGPDFLMANDSWFRGITIKYGPDGGVYISDWSDTGECHNHIVVDRSNGRLFKVTYGTPAVVQPDLAKLSDDELVKLQTHKNDWFVRHAQRLLEERSAAGKLSPTVIPALEQIARSDSDVHHVLRAMWTIHAIAGISPTQIVELLDNPQPYVRGWAIRLALEEQQQPPNALLNKLADMANSDVSPIVRLFLASALQRLPAEQRWGIAQGLNSHAQDAADQNLPLMIWYGVEPLPGADPAKALSLLTASKISVVRENIAHRIAQANPAAVDTLVQLLADSNDGAIQAEVLHGLQAAFVGQRQVAMPKAWPAAYAKMMASPTPELTGPATDIALTFGDPQAALVLRGVIGNQKAPAAARVAAVQSLVQAKDAQLGSLLRELLSDSTLRGAAIRGMAAVGDESTAKLLIEQYSKFNVSERADAIQTLSSRPTFALALIDAVSSGTVPKADISVYTLRQLSNLNNPEIKQKLNTVWGQIRPTDATKAAAIARYKNQLGLAMLAKADLPNGRAVFARTCAACHTLFDAGGKVGPNLTGSQRANLDYVIENVVDPSAIVAKEYQMVILATNDGRVLNGIVVAENAKSVTLRTTNEDVVVPVNEISRRQVSKISMMPDGLLDGLKAEEVRDLVGYLGSPVQVPMK